MVGGVVCPGEGGVGELLPSLLDEETGEPFDSISVLLGAVGSVGDNGGEINFFCGVLDPAPLCRIISSRKRSMSS